ncbi:MAG: hypothetical protein M3Q12_03080 [Pseudomonadota bacterium]|nr:hypothetical protein [Pseudomonadota bacterium]
MRKQYHFRESENRLLAWDVDRLILLTKDVPPFPVALDTIGEIDESYWYEIEDPPPTCRDLMEHMRLVEAADLAYVSRADMESASPKRQSMQAAGELRQVLAAAKRLLQAGVVVQPQAREGTCVL